MQQNPPPDKRKFTGLWTCSVFVVAFLFYLYLPIASLVSARYFNSDSIIDTTKTVSENTNAVNPNLAQYRSFVRRMYLTSPLTVLQYNDIGNSENLEEAKNYFYPKDLYSQIYGLAWHLVDEHKPTFVWDEMSASSAFPLAVENDYAGLNAQMNGYHLNVPHAFAVENSKEGIKNKYQFSLFAKTVFQIGNYSSKPNGFTDLGAPHTDGKESDLMAALDRRFYQIWKKDPNTDATENYPTGKKDEIETEWDNTDKYVQGEFVYFPDTTKQLVQNFESYAANIKIKGYFRDTVMDEYFSKQEIEAAAPKFFENLTIGTSYVWTTSTNKYFTFTYTPKYVLPTVIMNTVDGKNCNGNEKLDDSEVNACMDNFRIVSGLPPHDIFVNENENIQPWGPLCLKHDASHINEDEVRTKFQWFKPKSAFLIERFVRFIVGSEQDKEGLKDHVFVEIKTLNSKPSDEHEITLTKDLPEANSISLKDLTDKIADKTQLLSQKSYFSYTPKGKNAKTTYYELGCISSHDASAITLMEDEEQESCRAYVFVWSNFFQAMNVGGAVWVGFYFLFLAVVVLRSVACTLMPGWLGDKKKGFVFLKWVPKSVSFLLDMLIFAHVLAIIIFAIINLTQNNCIEEDFGLTTVGKDKMGIFEILLGISVGWGTLLFILYVIDYGPFWVQLCTKEGREDAFKVDAASVYVSVTQSNIA